MIEFFRKLFSGKKESEKPICFQGSVKHPLMCKGPCSWSEYAENDCITCEWFKEIEGLYHE